MTIKEAISQLKSLMRDRESFFSNDGDDDIFRADAKACEIAIEALEKQIPKNVITQTESDREFEDFLCPHCKVILQQRYKQAKQAILYKHKFCSDCGQALDWSDNE